MTRLLLLHGNASWRASWRRVLPLLPGGADAPDLPGFGDAAVEDGTFLDFVRERVREAPCVLAASLILSSRSVMFRAYTTPG